MFVSNKKQELMSYNLSTDFSNCFVAFFSNLA